jgi:hypothetical protein
MSETVLAYRAERTPDPVVEPDRTEPYRDVTEKSCYTCGHYPLNKNVAAGCSKRKEDEITCMDSPARPFWTSRAIRAAGTAIPKSQYMIRQECDDIKALLLEKNRRYGNSALAPLRVFSKADGIEQLRVRIDDKLSRIISGQADDSEDVIVDLIGYLILLRVAIQQQKANKKEQAS